MNNDKCNSGSNTRFLMTSAGMAITAIFCNFLWGSAFPAVKIGYRLFDIPSSSPSSQILFGGIRFTLAGFLVVIFGSIIEKRLLFPNKKAVPKILKLCLFQTVLQYVFFNIGLAHTSGVKSSIIEASSVFMAVIISGLLFRMEKVTANKILGCIIGFVGVVLVNLAGSASGNQAVVQTAGTTGIAAVSSFTLTGEGFILISTVSYAFSTVLMKKYSRDEDPVMLSGYQFIAGGLIMIIIGACFGGHVAFTAPSCIPLMIYLAFISSAAYSLLGLLLKYHPVSRVAVFGFTNPVFGVLLSALFLNETDMIMHWQIIAALPLVCDGIWCVNRAR